MLFFVSCEELERLTVFEIDYDSEFTVASTTIIDVPISIENLQYQLILNPNLKVIIRVVH